MFQKLLVPLDGSAFGELSLSYARSLAGHYHSEILLLHVVSSGWEGEMRAEMPSAESTAQAHETHDASQYLREKEQALRDEGFRVTAVIRKGEPVHEMILDTAVSENADTIIMSTHGFTGLKRLMFGNVAEKVISRATKPVLLIRPPDG
ncbi:MAG TPA: universal stress protein [Chloroflexota bacterium]|nr:universal stress protein [Chloroflexota bacterium]HUM71644.1 universal stress protein [Chloroflexota bacterium]